MIRDIWLFIQAIFERMDKIHISLIAAGIAFYAMFAVFPGLAALFALWGLWLDPALIEVFFASLDDVLTIRERFLDANDRNPLVTP